LIELNKDKERLILVTNDDGIHAKGLSAMSEAARQFGDVVVVAPMDGQSGMAHAITVKTPIRVHKLIDEENFKTFSCSGTPVDCVKMAINVLLPRKPDLILSGINHGANSSSSIIYSGTMAGAIEGCLNQIPSIGFSLLNFAKDADFTSARNYAKIIIEEALKNKIPRGICLNVNIPSVNPSEIKGIKVCRQNHGVWREEFDQRTDPGGHDYYWLTGTFEDLEPHAEDTDEWALRNNYVSVVPVKFDLTAHHYLENLKKWKF
jgi:5'-nucleotidase